MSVSTVRFFALGRAQSLTDVKRYNFSWNRFHRTGVRGTSSSKLWEALLLCANGIAASVKIGALAGISRTRRVPVRVEEIRFRGNPLRLVSDPWRAHPVLGNFGSFSGRPVTNSFPDFVVNFLRSLLLLSGVAPDQARNSVGRKGKSAYHLSGESLAEIAPYLTGRHSIHKIWYTLPNLLKIRRKFTVFHHFNR